MGYQKKLGKVKQGWYLWYCQIPPKIAVAHHIITGVKLHIDGLSVALPSVVLRAPVDMYNDDLDHEFNDLNDDIVFLGVVLKTPVDVCS